MSKVSRYFGVMLVVMALSGPLPGCSGSKENTPGTIADQSSTSSTQESQPRNQPPKTPLQEDTRGIKGPADTAPGQDRTTTESPVGADGVAESEKNAKTEIVVQEGHASQYVLVEFSPDSALLISTDAGFDMDGALIGTGPLSKHWDVRTGRLIRTIKGDWTQTPTSPGCQWKLDYDGKNGTLIVRDATSQQVLHNLNVGKGIRFAASADGRRVLSSCPQDEKDPPLFRLWDLESGQVLRSLRGAEEETGLLVYPQFSASKREDESKTQSKPKLEIGRVVISANGKLAISAGVRSRIIESQTGQSWGNNPYWKTHEIKRSNSVTVWDLETGRPISALDGAVGGDLFSTAFSPDGKSLLIGLGGTSSQSPLPRPGTGSVTLFDVQTGKSKWKQDRDLDGVSSVAFSPDGKHVAYGSGHVPCVLEAATGKVVQKLEGLDTKQTDFVISPNGRYAAYGSAYDPTVYVWDLTRGSLLRILLVQDGARRGWALGINGIAFSSDSSLLAASALHNVRIWGIPSGRMVTEINGTDDSHAAGYVAFHPAGRYLALGGRWGAPIQVWDILTGKKASTIEGLADCTGCDHAFKWSPDGKRIATFDGIVKSLLLEPEPEKSPTTDTCRTGTENIAWSPDGIHCAVSNHGGLTLLSLNQQPQREFKDAVGADFLPDGKTFLSRFKDGLRLVDVESGEMVGDFGEQGKAVGAYAVSDDVRLVAARCKDNKLRVWDLPSRNIVCEWSIADGSVPFSLVFAPDRMHVLTMSEGDILRVWDLPTPNTTQAQNVAVRGGQRNPALTPDGKYVVPSGVTIQ